MGNSGHTRKQTTNCDSVDLRLTLARKKCRFYFTYLPRKFRFLVGLSLHNKLLKFIELFLSVECSFS